METDKTLENFMKEFFPFKELCKAGFFKKEWKKNYKAQADKVCYFFGFETVYEYGAIEVRGHISYDLEKEPMLFVDEHGDLKEKPFITEIKSIYK